MLLNVILILFENFRFKTFVLLFRDTIHRRHVIHKSCFPHRLRLFLHSWWTLNYVESLCLCYIVVFDFNMNIITQC